MPSRLLLKQPSNLIVGLLMCFVLGSADAQEDESRHMSETLRSKIDKLVIVPGNDPTEQDIAGSYDPERTDVYGDVVQGMGMGTPTIEVGPVNVSTSAPQLILPGAILGGLYGSAKRRIQDFRDALTEELASTANQPLTNSSLALQTFWDLNKLPQPEFQLFAESIPVPEDADAILFVSINNIAIDVNGDQATLKTTAEIAVRRRSDNERLYRKWFYYQDKDTLSNWTSDDNALWHNYANFARHYLGREISAEVFSRVKVQHELRPVASDSLSLKRRDPWRGTSKVRSPTLAWKLTLPGNDPDYGWTNTIDSTDIKYDIEIYDTQRPVYEAQHIAAPSHALTAQLEPCKTYRWSVRPSYRVDGKVVYGEWMRMPAEPGKEAQSANVGEKASAIPAYIQGFAELRVECRAK